MSEGDFEFSCPACGGRLLGSPAEAGQRVQCSYCSAELTIPLADAGRRVSPPAPPLPVEETGPYAVAPPPPPAWDSRYPPQPPQQYGAAAYVAAAYGQRSYAAPGYGSGSYYRPPGPRQRNLWPLLLVLGILGVLVTVGLVIGMRTAAMRPMMAAHWSLTKSATGRLASAEMDLNNDGTFQYQCTNIAGRSFRANGTWQFRNRRLTLTVQSSAAVSPFGKSTVLPWDVKDVNDTTLHLHVKEGEQYWRRL